MLYPGASANGRQIRYRVVKLLGHVADRSTVERLAEALEDEPLMWTAARALAKIGTARALGRLMHALKSEKEKLRRAAAQELGTINDPRTVALLLTALKSENQYFRAGAAQALGDIGSTRAVNALISALTSDERSTRTAAAEGLGEAANSDAVRPLIAALTDDHREVRWEAARAWAASKTLGRLNPCSCNCRMKTCRFATVPQRHCGDWGICEGHQC